MGTFSDFAEHHLRGLPTPELRQDAISGRWVIIATDRANRPIETILEQPRARTEPCPFCTGHEQETPPEVSARRDPDSPPNSPGWRVRVVPNRFPALQRQLDWNLSGDAIFAHFEAFGVHEVIIESPEHETRPGHFPLEQLGEVLEVYCDRLADLKKDTRLKQAIIFKNVGLEAGASLEHVHSQLIAMPLVPIVLRQELSRARRFLQRQGRCVYCDMVQQEIAIGKRIVFDTPGFLAIAPFASRFPFETCIIPKHHSSHYEDIKTHEIEELAMVLKTVLLKLEVSLDNPAYNYIVHTSPFDSQSLPHYHWHIEIIPRLTRVAGFELGTGFYINPVPPEQAAEFMRQVEVDLSAAATEGPGRPPS